MITFNQTPANDNNIIFVFKFNLDDEIVWLSTKTYTLSSDNLTLDGAVITKNGLSSIDEDNDIISGGGVGTVSNTTIMIANHVKNATFKNFFEGFFPANKTYLIHRSVDIGVLWEGATSISDITWLQNMIIQSYQYDTTIKINLVSNDAAFNIVIPFYKVQSDFDNGISYFPNAPEESVGKTIPLVYGDFNIDTVIGSSVNIPQLNQCSPIIPIEDGKTISGKSVYQFIIASHKIKGFNVRPVLDYPKASTGTTITDNNKPEIAQYEHTFKSMSFIYNTEFLSDGTNGSYANIGYTLYNNGSTIWIDQTDKDTQGIYKDIYIKFGNKIIDSSKDFTLKHLEKYSYPYYTEIELLSGEEIKFSIENASQESVLGGKFDKETQMMLYVVVYNPNTSDIEVELRSKQVSTGVIKYTTFTVSQGMHVLTFNARGDVDETYEEFNDRIFSILNKDTSNSVKIRQAFMIASKILMDGFGFHYVLATPEEQANTYKRMKTIRISRRS